MSQINSICIAGGGSAGWMTAALLSKKCKNIKITLIESPNVPTIGVGESTLGHINKFLNMLELKDEDWMKQCNATYKSSIKFTDFRKPGTYFHYPFGEYDLSLTKNGIMDWFLHQAYNNNQDPVTDFAEFFIPQTLMTDRNKMSRNEYESIPGFSFPYHTAYHMDAEKFGQFLKNNICLPNGVSHIQDTIVDINLTNDGEISSIITENGLTLTADLYIDCTGFKKLLIEKTLGGEFIEFKDTLLNDRAIATKIQYIDKETEMHSVTNCTAIECGWVWDIPLYHRRGSGYVYSSKFSTQEQAEKDFKKHLALRIGNKVEDLKFNHIKIRHGIQREPWLKNVCSIGLALGFIEPLESTGLLTTHENVIRLVSTLQRRNGYVNQLDKDGWNFAAREEMEGFKQFVSVHYGLSEREDTPYWKHVTNNINYVKNHLDLIPEFRYNNLGMIYDLNQTLHLSSETPDGKTFIIAGMGLNPMSNAVAMLNEYRFPDVNNVWTGVVSDYKSRREKLIKHIDTLPTHYQFLKENIYNGED